MGFFVYSYTHKSLETVPGYLILVKMKVDIVMSVTTQKTKKGNQT